MNPSTESPSTESPSTESLSLWSEPLTILAHELRNPIGAIRFAVRTMDSSPDPLPVAIEQARAVIGRQLGQLSALVEDLLDLSRASRGALSLSRCSLDVLPEVRTAIETCTWSFVRRRQSLITHLPDAPLFAYIDATRFRQVIINLLDNACKFTPVRGDIELRLQLADAHFIVSVRDNGSGIVSERLPHVFDPFERACLPTADAPPGLGVGLALVWEIVALHGGHVEVHSDGPGCGSTFLVRLPVQPDL